MKAIAFLALLVGLVPFQMTLLGLASLGSIRPDLCLIAAILGGLFAGEWKGLALGIVLGFLQNQFSAGDLWLNLIAKGGSGFVAGRVSLYVTNTSTVTALVVVLGLSTLTGALCLLVGLTDEGWTAGFYQARSILLPEAMYNTVVGAGLYWLLARWLPNGSS